MSWRSPGAMIGLEGLSAETQRGLVIAFATSVAVVMGVQMVYPVLPPLMQQLGVDETAIGLVITVYTIPSIFLAPIVGALVDLRGRRPVLIAGLLLFGIAGAAIGLAPTFEWVLALRFVQGLGVTLLSPLTIVLLSDLVPDDRESSAQGFKVVIDRVSTAIVPILAGSLAIISWSLPFWLFGLAVPLAVLSLWWLPETKPTETSSSVRAYLGGFGKLGKYPRLLLAFFAGFIRFFLDYGYFTYLPIYLSISRGTSPTVIGAVFACFAVGAIITASQAGRLVRRGEVTRLVFLGFAIDGISVVLIPFLPTDVLVGVAMFAYGIGNGLISPLQKSLLTRNAPVDLRGGVISLDRVIQQIAKSIAPGMMGLLLLVTDIGSIFWILGAISLASIAVAAALVEGGLRLHRTPVA